MSQIFTVELTSTTTTRPRPDAKVRIQAFKPGGTQENGYIEADLLEFHPDFDDRLKFRAYALVRSRPEFERPEHAHIYQAQGVGYLDQPYVMVNEVIIHPGDLREMTKWCRDMSTKNRGYTPLIIHKQPIPFPMFKKGDRVICIKEDTRHDTTYGVVGEIATCVENSSAGGMSIIRYDRDELNKGFKSLGVDSRCLRLVDKA